MNKQEPEQTQENLRKLLEQHWLHCRHLESERSWFMNAYAVVVGGVVAFIIGGELKPSLIFYFLFAFLVIFTFVGFFLTTRWTYAFEYHRIRVNKLAKILWLESGSKASLDPTMDIPAIHILPEFICGIRIPDSCRRRVDDLFRTRYWFALFYLFILIGLLIFSIIGCVRHDFSVWLLVLAGIALGFAFYLLVRWWFLLARIHEPKKVVLEGCNGEWAQKQYLPFLVKEAAKGNIELWSVDEEPEIKLGDNRVAALWQDAQNKENACYLDKTRNRKSYEILSSVDYVFIVTPDRCHCKVAEFWLSRLSTTGKIFIEKPLDASVRLAKPLKAKILNKNVVYGFDHYLASLYPFLRRERQYLAKIGGIKSLKINILENDAIPPHQVQTLKEGMIFDLFPHVLAVSAAIVEKKSAPTEAILQTVEFKGGARVKYMGWPFPSETRARIKLTVSNKEVTSMVGKGIGKIPKKRMKRMVVYGTARRKIEINFQTYSFSMKGRPKRKLESKPVASFLEAVLKGDSIDSAPGVLSFGAAFEILEWLSSIRRKINMGPDYDIGTRACQ
jgi:predicted dehydrogenase